MYVAKKKDNNNNYMLLLFIILTERLCYSSLFVLFNNIMKIKRKISQLTYMSVFLYMIIKIRLLMTNEGPVGAFW